MHPVALSVCPSVHVISRHGKRNSALVIHFPVFFVCSGNSLELISSDKIRPGRLLHASS